jgi:hypothetical protein
MTDLYNVIISDAFSRKAFDLVFLCRRKKIPYLLFDDASLFYRILLSFIYFKFVYSHKNIHKVLALKDRVHILLPVEEVTMQELLSIFSNDNFPNVRMLFPDSQTLNLLANKSSFRSFCSSKNFSSPRVFGSIIDLKNCLKPIHIIAKPNLGSGSKGIFYFKSISDCLNSIDTCDIDFLNYTIEEYIPNGHKVIGGFYLYSNGKLIDFYSHERLLVHPAFGGVTIISRSTYNVQIKNQGAGILNALKYNGLAMIEFVYDPRDNSYKVIEVNPRIWGSFILSDASAKFFLENYINICLSRPLLQTVFREAHIVWPHKFIYLFLIGKANFFMLKNLSNTIFINLSNSNIISSIVFYGLLSFRRLMRFPFSRKK